LIAGIARPRGKWVRKVRVSALLGRSESREGKEEAMKRIRLLILLGVVAVALPLGVVFAGSAGAQPAFADVAIEPNAQYDIEGSILHVELKVTCTGGAGSVVVDVTQSPPETEFPFAAGSGPRAVICDGGGREVAVTVFGEGFDAGKAFATATLTVVNPDNTAQVLAQDVAERIIDIRVV
jgi:hypothetical protein